MIEKIDKILRPCVPRDDLQRKARNMATPFCMDNTKPGPRSAAEFKRLNDVLGLKLYSSSSIAAFDTSAELVDYIPDTVIFTEALSFGGEGDKQLINVCTKLCEKIVANFQGTPEQVTTLKKLIGAVGQQLR